MRISTTCIHIDDSYKITDRKIMEESLRCWELLNPRCEVFKRGYKSLINEWVGHNRLYRLGLWRSHTKDVDLQYPITKFQEIIWKILSI